jgi:hypothetical protein
MRLVLLFVSITALACADPVRDDAIAALGPETGTPGPTHRAGQPCALCHDGSTASEFAVGGTVFATQGTTDPAVGAIVEFDDLTGKPICSTTTNSVGNFFLHATSCNLTTPFKPKVILGDVVADMTSRVGRDRSCATCHKGTAPTAKTVEGVYLNIAGN